MKECVRAPVFLSVSDIGGKVSGFCLGDRRLQMLFREGGVLIFWEKNLETSVKALKECLSFDLISWLLGLSPKEIIR